jgi:hypothetical protein
MTTDLPTPPNFTPEVSATIAACELETMRKLLVHLDCEGLQLVRRRLKDLDLVHTCGSGPLALLRADLLDATCRLLVALEYAPAMYFTGCGDMFPDTPDVPDFGDPETL